MSEATLLEAHPPTLFHIDLAQVCVVDGSWQDEPDHLAAFDEARLGAEGRGRGNLYVLLDVSGQVEGRADVERELIETLRREYAARRGSVTFGLAEALRAANANLHELNLTLTRDTRRMAGVSAVVLRGCDLYIAQAGPAVVYACTRVCASASVEASERLARYPAESAWFAEDQPLISPQGNAAAPLGVRREFACDLFHTSVNAGDVFMLATRALTQLASTEELTQAFANRGAEDIASFLEEIANGADLTALVAEIIDPRDLAPPSAERPVAETTEPQPEPEPVFAPAAQRLFAAPAVAGESATPIEAPPALTGSSTAIPAISAEERLARLPLQDLRRAERQARRAAQLGAAGAQLRAGLGFSRAVFAASLGRIDWPRVGAALSRALNFIFTAAWLGLALAVRLILPGAPAKAGAMPRRAVQEGWWLQITAVLLPLLLVGLAFGIYKQQEGRRDAQAADLVRQAKVWVQSAEGNLDKNSKREQLNQGLALIRQARKLRDTPDARDVQDKIQDQLNELNGIAVLYYLVELATFGDTQANLRRVVASDNDVYILDRGAGRVYHYVVNESATRADPARGNGVILSSGDKVGNVTVDQIRDIVWAEGSGTIGAGLVAVTGNALLQYRLAETSWRATALTDAGRWGDVRAVDSFSANVYLLDAGKNQLWKYLPTADGYAPQAAPYLAASANVSLARAVDLAIDSDVWVLNDTGAVYRFRAGQRIGFELSGLDAPLKNPVAIFTRPEVDTIYAADAGNQRIVEFDKNGRFVRQFKPRSRSSTAFNALKSLFANEAKRKFFFINGNTVYLANLPK